MVGGDDCRCDGPLESRKKGQKEALHNFEDIAVWKSVDDLLKRAGEIRDGFLVMGAIFYFFGYIVWAINAYRNDLGLLPALEFQ